MSHSVHSKQPAGLMCAGVDISKTGVGVGFIGTIISTFLSGAVFYQGLTYLYSNKDQWFLRLLVLITMRVELLDLSSTICKIIALYHFVISHFGDLSRLVPYLEGDVLFSFELFISLTVVLVVELFFASRLYFLRRTHWSVTGVVVIYAVIGFALGIGELYPTPL
uniref:Uncharacterized protein n=1 Tax=Moniliophthora roreri TaxID=221103 RepID=A0A0W0FLR7_MONRR